MLKPKKLLSLGIIVVFAFAVTACAPKVGTPEWCADMKDKPKGDWSTNDAFEFTKNCLI